eukprot:490332-Prorocentrum_minimum.AAC.1
MADGCLTSFMTANSRTRTLVGCRIRRLSSAYTRWLSNPTAAERLHSMAVESDGCRALTLDGCRIRRLSSAYT